MEFDKLLKLMVEKGASDLFITAGKPPMVKVNGKLYAAGNPLSNSSASGSIPTLGRSNWF